MAKQLFGTDGIRGVAGEYPLDPRTAWAAGLALGHWARRHGGRAEVVIGMDTRESGPWLAEQVAGGLARAGVASRLAGVVSTPGIAYLTRTGDFVAGVMISASHNPYQDNGIKVFSHSGYKLPDDEEHRIEQEILRLREDSVEPAPVRLTADPSLDRRYIDYLARLGPSLDGVSIVIDCAHGSAHALAPGLFSRLGAEVAAIGCQPNGRNINLDCGALHLDSLCRAVLDRGADLGVAFDGDADRAIFVSRSGRVVNGDAVLLICGRWLHERRLLNGSDGQPVVVSTVMSNLGLEKALAAHGIRMVRTPVGDKYVLEEMVRLGAALGGEQSGHVIFRDHATTGDGLLTALRVLEVLRSTGQDLDSLAEDLKVFPQKLVNIRVASRRPLEELPSVRDEIRLAEQVLGQSGRIVVRFSGTEPLARVMIEAEDAAQVDLYTERIAAAIRRELG
ncbi:MAG: phosphoglucosamine mutase [Candidatus Eisenbacteria bacterium]|nr:phosphoglucosamine mutase [Candidatus Eisenbacteria bacterium]